MLAQHRGHDDPQHVADGPAILPRQKSPAFVWVPEMNASEDSPNWLVVPRSHIDNYLNICEAFSQDDTLFQTFKQSPAYQDILEHVSYDEGRRFISEMKNIDKISATTIARVKENDRFGKPETHEYERFGSISPSTLRYVKNALDIVSRFDAGGIRSVVEIGGGYGGLCKVLSAFVDFGSYTLIDLPEANDLSEKYLRKYDDLDGRILHIGNNQFDKMKGADLMISNYAFSELALELQIDYYRSVLKKSMMLYMVYNNFTVGNMNGTQFQRLASGDFNITMELECRPTHTNNIFYGIRKNA